MNSGTLGQVAFYNANGTAVSGTSTLTVSNEMIGIGTTTPQVALHVAGTGNREIILETTLQSSETVPQ